ncbi:MAG TPA: hypothetical protein VIB00_07245 [Pyrinomonadaceae bacterium]
MKIRIAIRLILPAALLVLGAAFTCAQSTKTNTRPQQTASGATTVPTEDSNLSSDGSKYLYEFTQPEFYLRHVTIMHDATGKGHIKFERKNDEVEVEEKFELSPTARERIFGLFNSLQFLDSQENYQSDKQFPHLGTMRITMEKGTRKRTVEFNWSNNRDAAALANEYRKITDQAVFLFDMSVARENQPLNAPKLLEGLETLLRRNGLSDPQQLIPVLKEISTDEHLPLIARNHALRILKKIDTRK